MAEIFLLILIIFFAYTATFIRENCWKGSCKDILEVKLLTHNFLVLLLLLYHAGGKGQNQS